MTLREEVLKNSGLLTEMPVIHEEKGELYVYFLTFSFSVDNSKKTIKSNDEHILSKPSEVLDFILTADKIKMEECDCDGSEPKSESKVVVDAMTYAPDSDGEYDTGSIQFKGTDAQKIIKYITSKFKNQMVKDINDSLELYTVAAKKSKEDPYMLKEYLSAIDSLKFAKDYINKI